MKKFSHREDDKRDFDNQSHVEHKTIAQIVRKKRYVDNLEEFGFDDEEEANEYYRYVR